MNIAGRPIGPGHPTFVVAELSSNHAGSLDRAKALVRAAAEAGADAVKLQTYRPEDLTVDSDHPAYVLEDGPWKGRRLWDLYEEAQTPWAWHEELFALADDLGLVAFSSVYSVEALAFLERLGCPAYKVASAEVADGRLLRAVAETGKPIILSDGMVSQKRMWGVVQSLLFGVGYGRGRVAVLRCVSRYPAPADEYNLRSMTKTSGMWANGPLHWTPGLSDHTRGYATAVAAVTLGARIVEAHLMLDPLDYGSIVTSPPYENLPPDAGHSFTPAEFRQYVDAIRQTEAALGSGIRHDGRPEGFRRRLVFARDMEPGAIIDEGAIRTARCGEGPEPAARASRIGRKCACPVKAGDPILEAVLQDEERTVAP